MPDGSFPLLFLPLFAQKTGESVQAVSLLRLTAAAPYVKIACFAAVIACVLVGVSALAVHKRSALWQKGKGALSLAVNAAALLLFIVTHQPYAAVFLLIFLTVKVLLFIKDR